LFDEEARMVRFPARAFLVCIAVKALGSGSTALATQTLTIDYSNTMGPAGDPIATGINGGWADSIPDERLYPIHPAFVRGMVPINTSWCGEAPMLNLWNRAESTGATVIIQFESHFNFQDPNEESWEIFWNTCGTNDYEAKMTKWLAHVDTWVKYAESHRVVHGRSVPVQYEMWNEPDTRGSWDPSPCYPATLFYELWNRTFQAVRDSVPGAIMLGPSLSGVDGNETEVTMAGFLNWCLAHGTMPDVLSWHDIYNSDPADSDMTGLLDDRRNLYAEIVHARHLVDSLGAPYEFHSSDVQYEVNEMIDRLYQPIPAYSVRNFALAERARADNLGLLFAGRTFWCDPCQTNCACWTQSSRLSGLLQPSGGNCDPANEYHPRYSWFVYEAYAGMTGSYLRTSPSGLVDAVAGVNANADTSWILVGNYSPTAIDLHVALANLDLTNLVVNNVLQVNVRRIPGGPGDLYDVVEGPLPISNARILVEGDSTVLDVPGAQFGPGDVLTIEVTRIIPGRTIARGE
jgi:hypothetical protein